MAEVLALQARRSQAFLEAVKDNVFTYGFLPVDSFSTFGFAFRSRTKRLPHHGLGHVGDVADLLTGIKTSGNLENRALPHSVDYHVYRSVGKDGWA